VDDFEAFFAEHYGPIVRALTIALGSTSDAEDAAQEAFSRALRRWPTVRAMDRPSSWVYVVAARDAGRSRGRVGRLLDRVRRSTPTPEPATDRAILAVEDDASFGQRIAALAPRQRTAVVLRFEAELSLIDIAVAMDCSVGTVKATLHAALKRLRVEHLEEQLDAPR
jgi:RNA polymerase sigma factor (sigma-70 family)